MPSPMLKFVYIRHKNNQKASLSGWEEGGTVDGGKVTQERITYSDRAKVTAKKE